MVIILLIALLRPFDDGLLDCEINIIIFDLRYIAVHPKQSEEIRRNIRGHSAAPNLATETPPSGTLRTSSRSKTPQHLAVDMPPMDDPDQDFYPKSKYRSRHRNSSQSKWTGWKVIIVITAAAVFP